MPDEREAIGLLALMLLHDSRRAARVDADGRLVLLADQDRSLWDGEQIAEGERLVARGWRLGRVGVYLVQASIAVEHARGSDWTRIAALYDELWAVSPTPIVALNRAVAIAERDGPDAGLAAHGRARARRTTTSFTPHGRTCSGVPALGDAAAAYGAALALTDSEVEREFLTGRLAQLGDERAGRTWRATCPSTTGCANARFAFATEHNLRRVCTPSARGRTRVPAVPDALAVTDLRKRYGANEALKGVDLTVGEGELVGLLGPERRRQVDAREDRLRARHARRAGRRRWSANPPAPRRQRSSATWPSCSASRTG